MDSEIIDDLLDQWEMARDEGRPLTVEELCRDHPDLVPEVNTRIQALLAMDAHLEQGPAVSPREGEPEPAWYQSDGQADKDPSAVKGQTLNTSVETQVFNFYRKGGGGAIYRGEDTGLGRQQAIKVILPQHALDGEIRRRFENEARVTARLEHPGIIPVYGTGETPDGLPFYTMRFVEDSSLDDIIQDFHKNRTEISVANSEFRDLLQRFVSICQTIAYAHSRGIVHRDIKPHNILLGRYGETLVIDWGLARPFKREGRFKVQSEQTLIIGEEAKDTLSHRSGTLAYMSPQQHSGLLPAPSDDIYSLGATLYKIICGRSPVDSYRDQSESVLREAIIEGRLHPPRRDDTSIPPALLAICQHAMQVEPKNRYRTAEDLANDVNHFIAGNQVTVYREPVFNRMTRWLSRHLRIAQILVGAALSLLLVWTVASVFLTNLAVERQRARKANLLSSAENFSRLLGDELDLRIRILETEARSPELIRQMREINETLEQEGLETEDLSGRSVEQIRSWFGELQEWVIRAGQNYDGTAGRQNVAFNALCVYNLDGYQVARYGTRLGDGAVEQRARNQLGDPDGGASTVGKNFRFRGYFHGSSFDATAGLDDLRPHRRPFFISSVYLSKSTDGYNFQITVPVFDPVPDRQGNRAILGLLGMPIEVGGLGIPANGIVINRRPVQLSDQSLVEGLILHSALPTEKLSTIPGDDLEQVNQALRAIADSPSNAQLLDKPVSLPAADGESAALQAVSPILIRSRFSEADDATPQQRFDTGWLLLTNEAEEE